MRNRPEKRRYHLVVCVNMYIFKYIMDFVEMMLFSTGIHRIHSKNSVLHSL